MGSGERMAVGAGGGGVVETAELVAAVKVVELAGQAEDEKGQIEPDP